MTRLETLSASKFGALDTNALLKIKGGLEDGNYDTRAGSYVHDWSEQEHGPATADCMVVRNGVVCEQEYWHADGYIFKIDNRCP